jgi:hypothetical protein
MLIIAIHVSQDLLTRRSTTCWDTVEELLLLAKSSAPSYAYRPYMPTKEKNHQAHGSSSGLDNTSAGIQSFKTMGLRTRIKALCSQRSPTKPGEVQNPEKMDRHIPCEELQLLIEGDDADNDDFSRPREDVEYGRI